MKQRKIAIVGTSSTSVNDAPYKDDTWEIWTLGGNLSKLPRFDLFFEVHAYQSMLNTRIDPAYMEGLKTIGKKLVLGHKWPGYTKAKLLDADKIRKQFGSYLNSTVAILIAHAMQERATTIGLWGVDMSADNAEYSYQKGCCEYLLGLAKGKGIEVVIAKESPLLRGTRIYGLDSDGFSAELCARRAELETAVRQLDEQLSKRQYYQGMLDVVNDQIKRWG